MGYGPSRRRSRSNLTWYHAVHPSPDTLDEYVLRRLHDASLDEVEQHVLVCEDCQAAIERIQKLIAELKLTAAIERAEVIDITTLRRARAQRA